MGQRSVPAPFLTKTYELVEDSGSDEVISWGESGESFVVWKTADFARDLLPKYFKHNNFSSFVRQLNTYGFRKVVPDKWEFANDNFKKGQPDLLSKIRRRKAVVTPKQQQGPAAAANVTVANGAGDQSLVSAGDDMGSTSTSSQAGGAPGSLDSNSSNQHHHPQQLADENEKLRRDNENLSSELARTKNQCEGLVAFLTKHLKVGSDQLGRIMHADRRKGTTTETCNDDIMMMVSSSHHVNIHDDDDNNKNDDDDDDDNDDHKYDNEMEVGGLGGDDNDEHQKSISSHNNADGRFKLFGVLLKGCKEASSDNREKNMKKRARVEKTTGFVAGSAAATADHGY